MTNDPELAKVSVRPASTREWEFAVAFEAVLRGAESVRVRRRYQALPRHNDVVDHDAVDTNDELLDRPDAVHLHTKFFVDGEYVADAHDAWDPPDTSLLSDASTFRERCRRHLEADARALYERTVELCE